MTRRVVGFLGAEYLRAKLSRNDERNPTKRQIPHSAYDLQCLDGVRRRSRSRKQRDEATIWADRQTDRETDMQQ